ncbi:ABC transporter [Aeromicrobium flavum]|uniref:ABC transporter n=1 Tax=Aeromicrobium flavum TaxID=416568 RepID=A0A512HXH5_9ACTN|nr:ABC transporter permease [Aeromicrobium flavum]GEO90159.1 ABC transporter [Aeromicrobium flavum]
MRTVLFASLRTHTRRYVAALVAVTIAVAFVVVIDALGSGARNAIAASVESAYPEADLIVGEEFGLAESDPVRVLEVAAQRGDEASVIATAWTRVDGPDGTLGDDVEVGTVATDPGLRSTNVVTGRGPIADDQALVSRETAASAGIELGDRLTVGTGQATRTVTVVGLTERSSYLSPDVHLTWPALSALDSEIVDSVAYAVREGSVAEAREALTEVVESQVQLRDDYVSARIVSMNKGVDVLGYLLLLFAAIAGFVAVLVIANTFTILFAQRTRDFALLRCVGATRRQVLRSVRVESVALALVAATTGVVGGLLASRALGVLARALAGSDSFGDIDHSPGWLGAAFVGGVVTTVVAAWLPTRAVVRVSPLAALRPAQEPSARTTAGRVRLALGLLGAAAGLAALVLAHRTETVPLMLAGGMVSFVGVLLLGPVIVPALLRLVGATAGRFSGPVRVASANAVRNPRRSAATTASLLVGVTLATAVLTGMASGRQSVEAEMNAEYPVDLALSGTSQVSPTTVAKVRGLDGVAAVLTPPGTRVETDGPTLTVVAPSDAERERTLDASVTRVGDDEIVFPASYVASFEEEGVPDRVTVRTAAGPLTLTVRTVFASWGSAAVVSPETLDRLTPAGTTRVLWVMADDGADAQDLAGTLGAVAGGADLEVTDNLEDQQWVSLQLDVLVWSVLGLLGVGVAIALVGIANTVGLSILERSREHALLRALGLTRKGLRHTLAAEGMLLALVAAVLGTALGTLYAWFGVVTVVQSAFPAAALVVPWAQLAAVLVVAALAGLASCVLPARRAARIMPAAGLTLD